jgi:ankyrin repeat protein
MKKISLILLLTMASAVQNIFAKKGKKENAAVSQDAVVKESEKLVGEKTPVVVQVANEELLEDESGDEDFAFIVDASALVKLDDNLFDAIKKNKIEDVKSYLDSGADVEHKNKDGLTPLMFALVKDVRSEIVQALLEREADVNTTDGDGNTALMVAAHRGRTDLVNKLFEHASACDPNARLNWLNAQNTQGYTALMFAAREGQDRAVDNLIFLGAEPNVKCSCGETALIHATKSGHLRIVNTLSRLADVDAQNNSGETALMIAVRQNNLPVVQALLANYANVNAKNNTGETALTIAVRQNNLPVVRALLDNGAEIFFDASDRINAFDIARKSPEMINLLLEYIPDADVV